MGGSGAVVWLTNIPSTAPCYDHYYYYHTVRHVSECVQSHNMWGTYTRWVCAVRAKLFLVNYVEIILYLASSCSVKIARWV